MLVIEVLPEGTKRFGMIDGVWVADYASALPLAHALRSTMLHLAVARIVVKIRL